jgi:hypothetical protein
VIGEGERSCFYEVLSSGSSVACAERGRFRVGEAGVLRLCLDDGGVGAGHLLAMWIFFVDTIRLY